MKLRNHNGISLLILLLVVVAAGLLISISIPFIGNRREELRQMEDIGNVRMAKDILLTEINAGTCSKETVYVYDAEHNIIRADEPDEIAKIKPYGRSAKRQGRDFDVNFGVEPSIPKDKILYVMINSQGTYLACWGSAPLDW
ncbi:hypothetical protein ACTNEN_07420 [Oribacterium sp. HCP28S3_H8]|uniref:hypothetical protein n=1 Tax=Oribacterium sp. HCP28S3_H8 TaxID=3438945 RepID=UPI003F8B5CE5